MKEVEIDAVPYRASSCTPGGKWRGGMERKGFLEIKKLNRELENPTDRVSTGEFDKEMGSRNLKPRP